MPRMWILDRRHCAAMLGIASLTLVVVAQETVPSLFTFEKPAFMTGPDISKSLMGSTYAYTARNPAKNMQLLITTMRVEDVREQFAELSDLQCINLFLDEVKISHERFFVVNMARPLAVESVEFLRFRWTGDKSRKTMTGVLSCGVMDGYYYVIHFVDELKSATLSFPAIRASLKTLKPNSN